MEHHDITPPHRTPEDRENLPQPVEISSTQPVDNTEDFAPQPNTPFLQRRVSLGKTLALCGLTCITAVLASASVFFIYTGMDNYLANQAVYGKLAEIRQTVDALYVGEYDVQDAVDMAAAGYVVGVGDQWSTYMSASDYSAYVQSLAGESFGIGVYCSYNGQDMRIIMVYEDSTAAAYNLERGDFLLAADGVTLADDGYNAVLDAITGEADTTVEVTFQRQASGEIFTATMTRQTTTKTMVEGSMLTQEGYENIGVIRIYSFSQQVETQFADVLEDLLAQGAQKLVFDVRNNPGGAVVSLCDMLDTLLPEGDVMTLREKDGDQTLYTSDAVCITMPMAVLINESTVSAAEFFAAALQEYEVAQVFGTQSLGKGYAQRTYELSDGSALHLSDQEYFTPQGNSLIGVGVVPDVAVDLPDIAASNFYFLTLDEDSQLKTAVEWLANQT